MIICVCRNIRDSDYATTEELIERIKQLDHNCGQCKEYCSQLLDISKEFNHDQSM